MTKQKEIYEKLQMLSALFIKSSKTEQFLNRNIIKKANCRNFLVAIRSKQKGPKLKHYYLFHKENLVKMGLCIIEPPNTSTHRLITDPSLSDGEY